MFYQPQTLLHSTLPFNIYQQPTMLQAKTKSRLINIYIKGRCFSCQ